MKAVFSGVAVEIWRTNKPFKTDHTTKLRELLNFDFSLLSWNWHNE